MIPIGVQVKQNKKLLKSVSLQVRKDRRILSSQLFDYYSYPHASISIRLAVASQEQHYLVRTLNDISLNNRIGFIK